LFYKIAILFSEDHINAGSKDRDGLSFGRDSTTVGHRVNTSG